MPTKVTAEELKSGNVRMRQGGSATDYNVPGTINYTIERTNLQVQQGVVQSTNGTVTVTYPDSFENVPHLMISINSTEAGVTARKITETASGFTCVVERPGLSVGVVNFSSTANAKISWTATGIRAS